jgi:hypothetical protein
VADLVDGDDVVVLDGRGLAGFLLEAVPLSGTASSGLRTFSATRRSSSSYAW